MSFKNIYEIIKCPSCLQVNSIEEVEEGLSCRSCSSEYPLLDGIPWIFRSPQESLVHWQQSIARLFDYFNIKASESHQALGEAKGLTAQRLETLAQAYEESALQLKTLLDFIFPNDHQTSMNFQFKNQSIESYYFNVFRDWGWPQEENEKCLRPLVENYKVNSLGDLCVLGAGSCRWSYDLFKHYNINQMVLLDINPFLFTLARRIILDGRSIDLTEIPLSPKSIEKCCRKWSLSAPEAIKDKISFLYADGNNLIFNANSFDTVATPWFLDILRQPVDEYIKRINRILKQKGRWIYFGPSGFNKDQLEQKVLLEELIELAQEVGFELEYQQSFEGPYLQSPLSAQRRSEQMSYLVFVKVKNSKDPAYFEDRPQWLNDFSLPIPKDPVLMQKLIESKIYFEVLSTIDGKRSLFDLISLVANHYGMTQEMATQSLVKYFNTLL
ncbi:MAG: class I SAM-dependent methyltransferase [Bdellovibrionales bacterium]|nr:class I SAM-dependent methyltransferase [Bdellovibrionales bacterium]